MTNRRLTLILLAMLSCSLSLAGCKDPEKEKAISEAAEAKAELAKLKTDLEKTESERDAIKADMAGISESFENTKSELVTVIQARDKLQEQVSELQEQAKNLQDTIEQLQDELKKHVKEPSDSKLYGVIFTTGLTEDNMPMNDLTEISINEERIYVFAKWRLSLGEYNYTVKIFDDLGKLINENQLKFTPQTTTWNTWSWYNINKYMDKPGEWKFEIYLDGQKMTEEHLTVLPQNESNSIEQRVPGRPLRGAV